MGAGASSGGNPEEHKQVTDFVLVGIEAHVCVQQTTLDLLEKGFNVHLCVDALSSSTPVDRACGLHRAECAAPASPVTHAHVPHSMPTRGVAGVRAPTSPRRKVCSWILSAARITRVSRRSQPTSRRPSWRSRLDFSERQHLELSSKCSISSSLECSTSMNRVSGTQSLSLSCG